MDIPWYKNAVFYGIDVRRFKDSNDDGVGDLQGLIDSLDYLVDLGVDALWLLPFYDTPFLDNGYDVRDYYRIDPRVGTLDDFARLVEEARQRHIRLVIDLVANHTSNQHPWFEAARRDPQSAFRDYYIWSESPPLVQQGEATIFPGEESNVWTYDPLAHSYYFHRFYAFQPDLRIANPEVRREIEKVMDFWLSFGISGFRLDAAAIMLSEKGLGVTRMKHPHEFFRAVNHFGRKRLHDIVLLGETNLPLDSLKHYFGSGDEMTMLLNFMTSMHIFLALARQEAEPLRDFLHTDLIPPAGAQWLNFLRNHDELTLDMLPAEQRDVVLDAFAPEANQRIYERGIRRRLAALLGGDRRKQELAFSLLFSMPGSALMMYGDEIGMGDDLDLPGRDAVRTPMQWTNGLNAGFSSADRLIAPIIHGGPFGYETLNVAAQQADSGSLLNWVKRLIDLRKQCPEVGLNQAQLVDLPEASPTCLLAHCYPELQSVEQSKPIYFFHNLAGQPVQVSLGRRGKWGEDCTILTGKGSLERQADGSLRLSLPEYGYLWLR